ncbi:MAG: 1-(5-phosphoribosyl)-5-[(5-phosphoribosylamino)methylideneamino]imidazole-4-carboxamide isomerase [Oscillospiraceae bacterium]|nr:1-(5-phosphoribosyl)-5-[(5-phosphoribosylamino)methylideneamino]imidazole-4-carboxamide isomerase [Oscillospiraceae bacterium]
MILLPAIDLVQNKAVRLLRGDYDRMTVYSDNPLEVAKDFEAAGAGWIHMVDLEGARDGGTPNFGVVAAVAAKTGLRVEVGGGVRDEETVRRYLEAGVSRVILGTAAVSDPAFLRAMIKAYGEKIAVGADLRDGFVAVKGWTETSKLEIRAFCHTLQEIGVQTVVCTDISKDGAMAGANLPLYRALQREFRLHFVASGGVSSLEDVKALRAMGLYGAIVGKAYYTGAVSLREAIEVAR